MNGCCWKPDAASVLMFTRCPDCQTVFRIRAEQLRAAAGKAHCCRCDSIFNAVENLCEPNPQEPAVAAAEPADAARAVQPEPRRAPASTAGDDKPGETEDDLYWHLSDPLTAADDDAIPVFNIEDETPYQSPADFNLMPAEDLFEPGKNIDVDIDVDLDQLAEMESPGLENDPGAAASTDTETHPELPFDVPDNLPPIQPSENQAPLSDGPTRAKGRQRSLAWSLLIIVLLLSALAQAAWLAREKLLAYPQARNLIQQFCQHTGCELPPRRAPELFEVLDRSVRSHPQMPQVLQILLTFSNQAEFDQPYPQIRLSLYGNNNELIARRRFKPEEYLGLPVDERSLVAAGQSVPVELVLEDPGADATGFKFDFL